MKPIAQGCSVLYNIEKHYWKTPISREVPWKIVHKIQRKTNWVIIASFQLYFFSWTIALDQWVSVIVHLRTERINAITTVILKVLTFTIYEPFTESLGMVRGVGLGGKGVDTTRASIDSSFTSISSSKAKGSSLNPCLMSSMESLHMSAAARCLEPSAYRNERAPKFTRTRTFWGKQYVRRECELTAFTE